MVLDGLDVRAVLVPLDGSAYAERAIRPAELIAARIGIEVGVLQVVADESKADTDYLPSVVEDRRVAWSEIVIDEDAAAGILTAASLRRAVVCMATHGHGRAKAIFGSTAEQVLVRSPEPIAVVGREVDTARLRPPARIVVALDGTDESERICEPAIAWAARFGLVVQLVTVAGEPLERFTDDAPVRRAFGCHNPDDYIRGALSRHATPGVELEGRALIDPISAASGLGHHLREPRDALLAMATHGRTGIERLIHGSVAGRILDQSPVPAVMFGVRQRTEH
jgi:nucleotide-binding universal stress UspA family protein